MPPPPPQQGKEGNTKTKTAQTRHMSHKTILDLSPPMHLLHDQSTSPARTIPRNSQNNDTPIKEPKFAPKPSYIPLLCSQIFTCSTIYMHMPFADQRVLYAYCNQEIRSVNDALVYLKTRSETLFPLTRRCFQCCFQSGP